jgi:5-methylcytosine-specific restriction endonuclease McrA
MPYKDPNVRRARAKERYRLQMMDPAFAESERVRNNKRRKEKMQDPNACAAERKRVAAWHREKYAQDKLWGQRRQGNHNAWRSNTLAGKISKKLEKMKYRARQKMAKGICTANDLRARVALYGGRCWVPGCGKEFEEIDHVIPLSKGGTNWPSNLRPICKACNASKGAMTYGEWMLKPEILAALTP